MEKQIKRIQFYLKTLAILMSSAFYFVIATIGYMLTQKPNFESDSFATVATIASVIIVAGLFMHVVYSLMKAINKTKDELYLLKEIKLIPAIALWLKHVGIVQRKTVENIKFYITGR